MTRVFTAIWLGLGVSLMPVHAGAQELPRLSLDPAGTSVSGLSSGAYMAVQMHVAFSASLSGAGVIAGGPYYCAQESLSVALSECMNAVDRPPDPTASLAAATAFAASGAIDPLDGLIGDRVYLFSGTQDDTVAPAVVDAAQAFYQAVGIEGAAFVQRSSSVPAGHGFLALDGPVPCAETDPPFINDCGIDQAGDLLHFLYGTLAPKTVPVAGNLRRFSQGAYISAPGAHSLADTGFVYIPRSCADGQTCRLHIAFHGCKQGIDRLEDRYASTTGYNDWAEANGIVVLYPQAISSLLQANTNGCWDWWGYDDADYATQQGPQLAAVAQMATALGAPMLGPGTETPLCVSHRNWNSTHWHEGRAEACGFGGLCVAGSGEHIGSWFGVSTLFETGLHRFQTAPCGP